MPDVQTWTETVTIPTYAVGEPERNPLFLDQRVYQGSSGAVYPLPVSESVADEARPVEWEAVFLENDYLKLMVLPALGGRLQLALDKTNDYPFVYYNRVIKPALVGLCGPWLSGGLEFNWPQHHRPTTYLPTEYRLEAHPDGSRTLWCAETEPLGYTRGMHGFTLYPDRAYLEVRVRLFNRTDLPQSFLWWANPAVHVNDDYQSVFPPDVTAVMDHGKRDVSSFPLARGTYYKVDYSPGTDISRYANIPVPTSYMAAHSDFDFIGCYDHGRQAGMVHVANHHLVPGKKQWTWGHGHFGRVWDAQLTDEDGPYIELMCGAFTDNQPDFSWLMPGERKSFEQVFLPFKTIGAPTNASRDAVVRLHVDGTRAELGVYVTSPRRVTIELLHGEEALLATEAVLDPTRAFTRTLDLPSAIAPHELTLRVRDGEQELVASTPQPPGESVLPAAAEPARAPAEVASVEELYLTGLHLEQYRHASVAPEPYWLEGLRRDPGDSRCHTALGRLLLRRGAFAEAEMHLRAATARLTARNPNPYDGEAHYLLGLTLVHLGRHEEAFDVFYKAVWNAAWQDAGYFQLARLATRAGRFEEGLELVGRALARNAHHLGGRHLRCAILRHLGREREAMRDVDALLALDCLHVGALYEQLLIQHRPGFDEAAGHKVLNWTTLALDYAAAGLLDEAAAVLRATPGDDPLPAYFLGWVLAQAGLADESAQAFAGARTRPTDYCFPNQLEAVHALRAAGDDDPRAQYYLGCLWYARGRHDGALACWERSRALDPRFPTVHRNLALVYYNQLGDGERAWESLSTAFALAPGDARVLFELDQLAKRLAHDPAERLARLEAHPELVARRDDLTVERLALLNLAGRCDEALAVLRGRKFHPWEGGEGKVACQWELALLAQAESALAAGEAQHACELLAEARDYPLNLGEGRLPTTPARHLDYTLGLALARLGEREAAHAAWSRAAAGADALSDGRYYNDEAPEAPYYQALALVQLGRADAARALAARLVSHGERLATEAAGEDYFAVSLPDFVVFRDDAARRRRLSGLYLVGLGRRVLGDDESARAAFDAVTALHPAHQGARYYRP